MKSYQLMGTLPFQGDQAYAHLHMQSWRLFPSIVLVVRQLRAVPYSFPFFLAMHLLPHVHCTACSANNKINTVRNRVELFLPFLSRTKYFHLICSFSAQHTHHHPFHICIPIDVHRPFSTHGSCLFYSASFNSSHAIFGSFCLCLADRLSYPYLAPVTHHPSPQASTCKAPSLNSQPLSPSTTLVWP